MSDPTRAELDPQILAHYAQVSEADRLVEGFGRLERERTLEILGRHLPPPPCRILDVGGGAGAYALPLASMGHSITLVDPVPKHVAQARAASSAATRPLAGVEVGDARRLAQADAGFDAVLLLGPLYHLTERGERLQALAEARRVLRPEGVLVAAAISRHASLLAGLIERLLGDPAFVAIVERDLEAGQHRNPTSDLRYFTTAFFHRPEELRGELEDAGFAVAALLAVEGPGWLAPDFESLWASPERRATLLGLVRRVESAPELLGASAHLIAVGRRA